MDHNSQAQEAFDVVEALYQEAELTRPKQIDETAETALTTQKQDEDASETLDRPMVIQSRKARVKMVEKVPLFTRISDLYEEAEAVKILAQEEAEAATNQTDDTLADLAVDDGSLEQALAEADAFSDPFLPASFDASDEDSAPNNEQATDTMSAIDDDELTEAALADALAMDDDASAKTADETNQPDSDFMIPATFGATDDELDILAGALAQEVDNNQEDDKPEDTLTISDAVEPAVSLDDAIDQLDAQSDKQSDTAPHEDAALAAKPQSEAEALAALDAARPQADAQMTQQLEDVRSAVANAQSAVMAPSATLTDEPQSAAQDVSADAFKEDISDEDTSQKDVSDTGMAITAGPELVAFIGETVRDVLDEQLPTLVRGLVDEALGERQGRYGRSDTPHIGLRTKPSRH